MAMRDSYILMCKNHEVARFEYSPRTRSVRALEALGEPGFAPPSVLDANRSIDPVALSGWISMRYIPHTREGISGLLREAGCANPAELMFSSLGLNLSDQYWFKPAGLDVDWHEVNYFENPYVDGRANELVRLADRTLFGPGTSTGGQVLKWWERRGETSYLVKGSTAHGHEPYAELLATRLYERLLPTGAFVPYALEIRDGEPFSTCPCFIDASTELATMDDILRVRCVQTGSEPAGARELLEEYVSALESMGLEDARTALSQMLVCDYLSANSDRHEYNLGAVLDAETKSAVRVAPIFDNGRGFFYGAKREQQLTEGLFDFASRPFDARPERQLELALALDPDVRCWLDLNALEGFGDEIAQVLSANEYLQPWFAEAASQQFELRLSHVRSYLRGKGA